MSKKDTELVDTKGSAPTNFGGIAGIEGMDMEDVRMPYVYLVRERSKHATLSDGKLADPGMFYHATRKTAVPSLQVIVALARKFEAEVERDSGEKAMIKGFKTLMIAPDNLYSPFSYTFKGMNYWYGWKDFVSYLMAEGVTNVSAVVIELGSRPQTTKDGREYLVTTIKEVRKTTEDELAVAKELASRFADNFESDDEETAAPEVAQVNIDVDELLKEIDAENVKKEAEEENA